MITKDSRYSEIRKYFLDNMESFPNTLDGGHRYWMNVKKTARLFVDQVDRELIRMKESGLKANRSKIAISGKNNLIELYNDLQNLDAWDKPMQRMKTFNNKYI